MLNKSTLKCYDKFCANHQPVLPLFYNRWFLDAACGQEQWGASIYTDNNDEAMAIWPYHVKSKYGLKYITMPCLTPYMGPWVAPKDPSKSSMNYGASHHILDHLNKQMPRVHFSTIHTHPELTNLLSLQWAGYQELKRYTYRLDLTKADLWENLDSKQRNIIRKASKALMVSDSLDIEKFYDFNKMSFERQSKKVPYSLNKLAAIDEALSRNKKRIILQAQDPVRSKTHGMIYLAYDQHTVYLLAIGSDPALRNQGSIPLLIWEGIRKFATTHQIFDFEGSMIPSIEKFFRSFGGTLTPYSRLFKSKNTGIDLILKLSGRYG